MKSHFPFLSCKQETMAVENLGAAEMKRVKVPQITVYFWIIKVLCTTVGETFADYLNTGVGLGLDKTTAIMSSLTVVLLVFQFVAPVYWPPLYWAVVVAISTAGTLFTDQLTDELNIDTAISCPVFFVILMMVFALWYFVEGTLAMHSIYTKRREGFYWLAILFTFALGTAAGDLISTRLNLGFGNTFLLFAGVIAVAALLWFFKVLGPILAFWTCYVLTRPLGASIGDFLAQNPADFYGSEPSLSPSPSPSPSPSLSDTSFPEPPDAWTGGLNLGTTVTSIIFLSLILVLIVILAITKLDKLKAIDDDGKQSESVNEQEQEPDHVHPMV
eukprot:TRINITY_DN558_c0_g1_i6.p1 TRINITY_DN558_c0_g1~~TRINITY_DN558_c0_g1_i6.p1  ORF type:complete len:330 (-),score=47.41 TRINITY_DN558_c0_g1_i6:1148-2137(-)